MLEALFVLLGMILGTLSDLKQREVADWVNYGMIGLGLSLSVLSSLLAWSVWPFVASLAGLVAGFVLGALMYYTGQWGGGDAKMIMGVGALLGLPVLPRFWGEAPLFLEFLIFTVLVGAAYGVLWMLFLSVRHRKTVFPVLRDRMHEPRMLKLRIGVMAGVIIVALLAFSLPWVYRVVVWMFLAMGYATFVLSVLVKVVESTCFIKKVRTKDLVEGDWIVGAVKVKGEVVVPEKNPGVTKEQISRLVKGGVKQVTVKEGIPFVPSFLIAFVIAYWWHAQGYGLLFWL